MNTNSVSVCILVWLITVSVSGCMQVRLLTYPPTFTWIDEDDIRSSMQTMAANMRKLDELVNEEHTLGSNQDEVLATLEELEYLASLLSIRTPEPNANAAQLPATNHLLIDEHMDQFLESVFLAKFQAQASPPSYFALGQLTGGCSGCHRYR